jgi:hypothetical protein
MMDYDLNEARMERQEQFSMFYRGQLRNKDQEIVGMLEDGSIASRFQLEAWIIETFPFLGTKMNYWMLREYADLIERQAPKTYVSERAIKFN